MPDTRIRFKRWRLWTPADITTLGWYDAQDAATIVQATTPGRVSQWTDKGSAGTNHLLQAVAGNQPTTGADNINGFNVLGFNGTAYFLAMGSNPFGASISNAALFMVLNVKSVAETKTTWSMTGSANAANRWQSHCPWAGTVYFDCGGTGGANRVSYGSGWAANKIALMSYYCSLADSVQQIYEGGTVKVGDATGHTVNTVGNPTIGSGAGGSEPDTCAIGEVIIINGTVSTEIRQIIEGYLAWHWGLTGDLAASHPFKLAPPLLPAA